jgi:flagella basal body P-ring formation protein FlgA
MKNLIAALLATLLLCPSAQAAATQSHARIREIALAYAQQQTQTIPGKVSIQIGEIDPRVTLRACAAPEAYTPSGTQQIGKTSIGVRCNEKPGWSIFVQATIRVSATILVANRPLAQNSVLGSGDFSLQSGELGQPGILTDPAQAIGKTLKFGIGAGQVLRQDMLRAPFVVTQGQATQVRVNSTGFSVRSAGQALNSGAEGQAVQVRMASGQVVSGIAAADGSVEVRP